MQAQELIPIGLWKPDSIQPAFSEELLSAISIIRKPIHVVRESADNALGLGFSCKVFPEQRLQTRTYFIHRNPKKAEKAKRAPKHQMALVSSQYLGNSARWAIAGDPDRRIDYQICVGPSMGPFNTWVKDFFLENIENRKVVGIALNLLEGASVVTRAQQLCSYGVPVPGYAFDFRPRPLSQEIA